MLIQIVAGLAHVHSRGIVHRDLKPTNVCFSHGVLKLMDFGLARPYGDGAAGGAGIKEMAAAGWSEVAAELNEAGGEAGGALGGQVRAEVDTRAEAGSGRQPPPLRPARPSPASTVRTSVGVGTASYSCPEQLAQGVARPACDLFPVGLIAFELFQPFGSAMERAKAFTQLRAQQIPPEFARRWPELAPLIRTLLAPRTADRPPCDQVANTLERLRIRWLSEDEPSGGGLKAEEISAGPPPASPRISALLSPKLGGTGLVLGEGAGGLLLPPAAIGSLLCETPSGERREGSNETREGSPEVGVEATVEATVDEERIQMCAEMARLRLELRLVARELSVVDRPACASNSPDA